MTEAILEARDLAKQYQVRTTRFGRRRIVHAAEGISLELRAGMVTAVVGESGSGKSTVSRLLARTTTPTS
ncbi:MAG TPA: ATP-binding cassette domain-containing protein, partial [Micromonosporaceae bacterium]